MSSKIYEISNFESIEGNIDWLIISNCSPIIECEDKFNNISNMLIIEVDDHQYDIRISSKHVIQEKINYSNTDTDYGFVRSVLTQCKINKEDVIFIDATYIIIPVLSFIYEYLRTTVNIENINILYNETDRYIDPYSFEFNVEPLVTQQLECYPQGTVVKRELMIYLIGFEGNCTNRIDRDHEPDKKIIINGFPSYLLGYKDISIINNSHLQSDDYTLDYCTASNPFKVFNKLYEIYNKYKDEYRISIAICGSTPSSIGAIMFASYIQDVNIITIRPKKYNFTKRNVKSSWLYKIKYC